MIRIITLCFLISNFVYSQDIKVPACYIIDHSLSDNLNKIIIELGLDKDFDCGDDGMEQISLAVIDLTKDKPHLGGVNFDNFIYPASVYKMYVAAEVLHQISQGLRLLP